MKMQNNFFKKYLLSIWAILGAIVGYLFLHPFGMVVHALFHTHSEESYLHLHWDEVGSIYITALSLEHLPQIISYVVLSALIGFLFGKLLKSYQEKQSILQMLALIDELTGLYNRRGFLMFAGQLLKLSDRTQKGLILCYLDLNNLKTVNDRYGHPEGDKMLVCVAEVLRNAFRGSDIIGRMGGDEFAVLALEAKRESINTLRIRIHNNIKQIERNKSLKCAISLSMGIVYYNPENPCPIEELIRRADILMYEEKKFLKSNNISQTQAKDVV